jgi:hypothetical protein
MNPPHGEYIPRQDLTLATYFPFVGPTFNHAGMILFKYEVVFKSFWTGHLEQELQVVQLSATRCSCITILWVSLVSLAAITLCVASQWVFTVVYFVINSVQKLLDIPSYNIRIATMLCGSITTAWHALRLWMKDMASSYGGWMQIY